MSKPRRAYELTLTLGADTYEELVRALEGLALDLALYPSDAAHRPMASGSPSAGYSATVTHDPEWTHERYHAEVEAYLKMKRGNDAN